MGPRQGRARAVGLLQERGSADRHPACPSRGVFPTLPPSRARSRRGPHPNTRLLFSGNAQKEQLLEDAREEELRTAKIEHQADLNLARTEPSEGVGAVVFFKRGIGGDLNEHAIVHEEVRNKLTDHLAAVQHREGRVSVRLAAALPQLHHQRVEVRLRGVPNAERSGDRKRRVNDIGAGAVL